MYIVLLIIAILLCLYVAGEFQDVARMKGFYSAKYGLLAFLIPIAGWILVAALPDRGKPMERSHRRDAADLDELADVDDDLPDL